MAVVAASPNRRPLFLKAVLQVLKDAGGEMRSREAMRAVAQRLQPTEYENARHEKTGYIRWWASLQLDSIRLVKAGWLRKKKGTWYLTEQGAEQVDLNASELWRSSGTHYRRWKSERPAPDTETPEAEGDEEAPASPAITFEQAVDLAQTGIGEYIEAMGPYDFQDLVAALLRGMGYHTPFVAPPGKDGGIDILAYRDPFGTIEPRIKVQVKHRLDTKVNAREVRELISLLNKQGDTGLIVSSGGFTRDAMTEVRHSPIHMETLDLDALTTLWEEHYDKLAEEDRALLPLRRIAFLAPSQE